MICILPKVGGNEQQENLMYLLKSLLSAEHSVFVDIDILQNKDIDIVTSHCQFHLVLQSTLFFAPTSLHLLFCFMHLIVPLIFCV